MSRNPNEKIDRFGVAHRTPIQEAETPQPRVPAVIDHQSAGPIDRLEDNIVEKVHQVEDSASRKLDQLKNKVSKAGEKAATSTKEAAETVRQEGESMAETIKNKFFGGKKKQSSGSDEGYPQYTPDGIVKVAPDGTTFDALDASTRQQASRDPKRDFAEGADKALDEDSARFHRMATKTKHKLDEAYRATDEWEKQSKEQIHDAWESAKTHTTHILQQYESRPVAHNLDEALTAVKTQNLAWQRQYMHDICERHPQRTECYSAVKKLVQLAKENARINLDMANRDAASKD